MRWAFFTHKYGGKNARRLLCRGGKSGEGYFSSMQGKLGAKRTLMGTSLVGTVKWQQVQEAIVVTLSIL
jgi:hypothetical protein